MRRRGRTLILLGCLMLMTLVVTGCGVFSSNYVRLRGSSEIHAPDCPKVRRAARDGVVPADLDDGVPCIECLHDEYLDYAD
jgi:hypothetical protein